MTSMAALIDRDAPAMVLAATRDTIASLAAGLDPESVTGHEAVSLIETGAEITRLLDGIKLAVAARAAESKAWNGRGARDPEAWLAKVNRGSVREALAELETAKALPSLPDTTAALRSGSLSSGQACQVADTAAIAPDKEAELVALAVTSSPFELRDRCRKIKNAATPTAADERYAANRKRRSLRTWTDERDMFNLKLETTVDDGARISAVLSRLSDKRFKAAYKAGEREPVHAYAADAFVEAVTRPATDATGTKQPSGSDAKVIIRVDLTALQRGHVEGDETCDLAGLGPIPVSVAWGWLGEAFIACIAENGRDVRVAHPGRRANAFQRSYLEWQGATCSTEGCNNRILEIDHTNEFAKTKHTTTDELARACTHCHDLRTTKGYTYGPVNPITGKRPLLPPNRAGP